MLTVERVFVGAAYPSLKPLASWFKDLEARMDFMHGWNKGGVPISICLPYIFFTQGFLTGALQQHGAFAPRLSCHRRALGTCHGIHLDLSKYCSRWLTS